MKNYSNSIGNRTRDLPVCSAVPQPTVPLRTPQNHKEWLKFYVVIAAAFVSVHNHALSHAISYQSCPFVA
jgi:hypothetical protein